MASIYRTQEKLMGDTALVASLLSGIKETFNKSLPAAKWCIHAGTALGAFLHQGALPGDHDLDFAVLSETCTAVDAIAAFRKAGCRLVNCYSCPKANRENVVCLEQYGIPFDVVWLYLREREYFVGDFKRRRVVRNRWWLTAPCIPHVLPAYLFDSFEDATFAGITVPAPSPLEVYCDNRWLRRDGGYPGPDQGGERLEVRLDWDLNE